MTRRTIDIKAVYAYHRRELPGTAKKAALKFIPEKTLTLVEAREYSKKLIRDGLQKNNCYLNFSIDNSLIHKNHTVLAIFNSEVCAISKC